MKTKKYMYFQRLFVLFTICLFSVSVMVAQEENKEQEKAAKEQEKAEKKAKKNNEKKKDINKARKEGLGELYKLNPAAQGEIASSYGYALFYNTGMNLFVLATGRGGGIAHNNASGQETYMKMISGGAGLGIGVKKYWAIFVFENADAFNHFITAGWTAEGSGDAAAKTNEDGGAVDAEMTVAPGVKLYQVTDVGFAAQATIQGTKFVVDDDLN